MMTPRQVNVPSTTTHGGMCSTYSIIHERPPDCFRLTINHQKIGACRSARDGSSLLPLLYGPKAEPILLGKFALAHPDFFRMRATSIS